VTVYEYANDGKVTQLLYDRTFENKITKELRIYGLDDDDRFEVKGKAGKSPLIRLIGGNGEDTFIDESKVSGFKRKTKIYDDDEEESNIEGTKETKDNRSHRQALNTFDYRDYEYNYTIPVPFIGFNPDEGLYCIPFLVFLQLVRAASVLVMKEIILKRLTIGIRI